VASAGHKFLLSAWKETTMNIANNCRCYMSVPRVLMVVLLVLLSKTATASVLDGVEVAAPSLIVHSARITTQNPAQPSAQAVAVRDGLVYKVGGDAEILALRSKQTAVIDARQRRLIPGLNDSHTHVVRGGRFYNLELRWEGIPSLEIGLEMIREQAKRTPEGQWVRVIGGWSPYQFREKRFPTVAELNAAAPDTPVFVLFLYSRGFLNKAGMETLGITAATKPPPGARYELDEDGNPTGVLIADPNPTILYQTIGKLPHLSLADQVNSSRQFYRELNRFGLTSAIDAGGGGHVYPRNYSGTETLAETGELPLRVSYFLFPQVKGREYQDFEDWMTITVPGLDEHNGLAHGYEMEGGGEFLVWAAGDFENFMAQRPEQEEDMERQLEQTVRLLVRNRWPFRIHATYNESIERILAVLEKVNTELPFDGLRWAIDHAETISPANIARVKDLGGGIAIQSRMAFAGEYFKERYGPEAAGNAPPLREMLNQGVPVGAGSDATRVSSYNPWTALSWLVSGRSVGGAPLLNEGNRLTREEALRLYTLGSAWFSGEEQRKGRIAPGQFADFALLSEDYFSVPEDRIASIESHLTVVGGRVVYGAGEFSGLTPHLPPVSPAWSPVTRYRGHWPANDTDNTKQ
jgi:predicted amidohydrolase YtcJ